MPLRKLYFESVRVGDEIPAMAKAPIDRVQLARYAGATGDFNPLSIDETYARGLGMPSIVAPSSLGMGFLGQLVTDWARGARPRRLAVKFSRMSWPGDTLVCKGRVTDRYGQDGKYAVELDVWAENQKGELVLRGAVTLQVFYSAEDENRFRAGQPPLIVNVPRESILAAPAPTMRDKPAKNGKRTVKTRQAARAAHPPRPKKPAKAKTPKQQAKKIKPKQAKKPKKATKAKAPKKAGRAKKKR